MVSSPRYVLFCGSRGWTDYFTIFKIVRRFHVLLGSFTVLHGGARGADTYAGLAARIQKIPECSMLANWARNGTHAGPLRNSEMLELKPIIAVAFWDGSSPGTLDTISKAVNIFRIPTLVLRPLLPPIAPKRQQTTGPLDHSVVS